MTYEETVEYIERIPSFTKKRSLDNTRRLLALLGEPQEKLQIIHVAGTNGKGSVCAYLDTILRSVPVRTALFTSPHLVTIRERFVLDGEMIDEETFVQIFENVMEAVRILEGEGGLHPAYFELLLVMDLVWAAQSGAQMLVMETGLGGLNDATNVIAHPVLCVITSISLDHTEYLGNTVEEIARQKAGIIKPGVPVAYDATDPVSARVIADTAKRLGSEAVPVYPAMAQITEQTDKNIAFVLNNRYYDYVFVKIAFSAAYQVMNCALAMTAARAVDALRKLHGRQIAEAVGHTRWSGRMECIAPGVIVDGAHNIGGISAFAQTAGTLSGKGPVSLLFAAVMEKDYENMIRVLCENIQWHAITVTQVQGHRAVDAQVFADIFRRYTDAPVSAVSDIALAYQKACSDKGDNGTLLCAGSLYLVGELEAAQHADRS